MNRQTGRADFDAAVERLLSSHPLAAVSTDIMVGFPGETGYDFEATLAVVDRVPFLKVHMFRFSARPGTAAADMRSEFVQASEAHTREKELQRHAQAAAERCRAGFASTTFQVLMEQQCDSEWQGYAENYLRVGARRAGVAAGDIVRVSMADRNNRFIAMG
jgi:threonylcarbamoyladenosine tRNA methylthiotransferase MtaB